MLTILTTIGVTSLLISIALFTTRKKIMGLDVPLKSLITKTSLILTLFIMGVVLSTSSKMFFVAEDGHHYYLEFPTGGSTCYYQSRGIKFRGYSKITDIKSYLTVSSDTTFENPSGRIPAIPIRFSDKVTGIQHITMRATMPNDDDHFMKIVREYRTQTNIVNSAIKPLLNEVVSNTSYMYTGQGYASGDAPNYKYSVRDQIINGSYVMEDRKNTKVSKESISKDSLGTMGGSESKLLTKKPKVGPDGKFVRIRHSIQASRIVVSQVSLSDVDFAPEFDKKLEGQRTQSAKIQEFAIKQKAAIEETKYQEAIGEKNKIIERLQQEKAAVKALIEIRTKLQRDSIGLQQALVLEQTAIIDSRTLKTKKDAEAYANRKLVSAGLTPQQRANWEYKTAVGVAAEIAKMTTPNTIITGGGKGSSSTESLLQLQILNTLNTNRK